MLCCMSPEILEKKNQKQKFITCFYYTAGDFKAVSVLMKIIFRCTVT